MTYAEQMQNIWKQHKASGMPNSGLLREVAAWAIENHLWEPRREDLIGRCAEDLARALREEHRTDEDGRRYRAMHAARSSSSGTQLTLWADIDDPTTTRSHMEISLGQRRKAIVGDCVQLKRDVDHYNGTHSTEEPIQMILDFEKDVQEVEAMELEEETSSTEPRPQVAQFVNAAHP